MIYIIIPVLISSLIPVCACNDLQSCSDLLHVALHNGWLMAFKHIRAVNRC